jgi:hypothetical protein
MADVPTYERKIAPEGQPQFDSNLGGDSYYGRLRGELSALANKVGGMADRATAAEGETSGLMAGLDPNFRPGRENTIYGQAYDRAGTRAFLDSQQNALDEQMSALSLQYEADPAGLAKAIADLQQQTTGQLKDKNFPEADVAFAGFFARARTSYVRAAIKDKADKDKANWLATGNAANQRRNNEVDRITHAGGLDPEAQKVAAGVAEDERRANEALVGAGVITPEEARKRNDEVDKRTKLGPFIGAFDNLKTIGEKRKLLADLDKQYNENTAGLADLISGDDYQQLRRYMEVKINGAEADNKAAISGIDRAAGSVEDRAAEGFPVPPAETAALRANAEATGDPAAIARVDAAEQFQKLGQQLVSMSPMEIEVLRRQTVLDMEKNGASQRSMDVLSAIDKVKGKMTTALDTDPYAWGARSGTIKPVPALTMTGDMMAPTFAARLAARDTLRARYGRKVPFFTSDEKETIAYIARNGGPAALQLAQGLIKSLGKEAPGVLAEISDDAPVLTNMAGRLAAGGSLSAAQDAMAAIEARKDKDFKPIGIPDAQESITASGKLGGAYLADPKSEAAVRAEAKLMFEKRARDRGLTGKLDNDPEAKAIYEQALDDAAGATTRNGVKYGGLDEVNGVKIVLPPNVRAGEVEQTLHRITSLAYLPPIGAANGVAITPQQLQGATLVTIGNGKYRAALGDPRTADPRYVMKPDGSFWTVTVDQLRAAAPVEEPDLPLGNPMGDPF